MPGNWQCRHPAAIAAEDFGLDFTDLLRSVDVVVTKPGYGTFSEAACNGTPVIFQRRDDWPEQDCLIEWLLRHGICHEISARRLQVGDLADTLQQICQVPTVSPPPTSGIAEAVASIGAIIGRPAH